MTASIQYSKTIPVREDVDVFVAGGGPAGVAAALSIDAGCAVQDLEYARLREALLSWGQVVYAE